MPSCTADDAARALLALRPGEVLVDERLPAGAAPGQGRAPMAGWFPLIVAGGQRVHSVTPAGRVGHEDAVFAAILVEEGDPIGPHGELRRPALGLLACRPDAGWTLITPLGGLVVRAASELVAAEPTTLPGGSPGSSVTVATRGPQPGEYSRATVLVGPPRPGQRTVGSGGAGLANLGLVGTGASCEADGEGFARRHLPYDATGWFPFGDEIAFVFAARRGYPTLHRMSDDESEEIVHDEFRAEVVAAFGPEGMRPDFGHDEGGTDIPAWVLVGSGAPPAWCHARADVRCGPLTMRPWPDERGALPLSWIAGAWPVDSPIPPEIRAPRARWLFAGRHGSSYPPPRDPSGQPTRDVINLHRPYVR